MTCRRLARFAFLSLFLSLCSACASSAARPFDIGLIGDAPYSPAQEQELATVIEAMNAAKLAFVAHVGDLQVSPPGYRTGVPPCTDEALLHVRSLLGRSRHPVVITPGDNDWTDCHETKPPSEPEQRLGRLRELFFVTGQTVLHGRLPGGVTSQSAAFPENLLWTHNGVLFVTLHLVGSNNNLGRTPQADAEHAARSRASIAWLRHAFAVARAQSSKAVMIVTHANPYFEDRWPRFYIRLVRVAPPSGTPTGFTDFLAALEEEVTAYGKPVLMAHGDSHYFRVDKPLFRAGTGELVANFTRVETFGSPYVHWVHVHIDPSSEAVFTFRPELRR